MKFTTSHLALCAECIHDCISNVSLHVMLSIDCTNIYIDMYVNIALTNIYLHSTIILQLNWITIDTRVSML